MTRATFTIAVAFLCSTAVGEQPTVIFLSPCECQGFHGKTANPMWLLPEPLREFIRIFVEAGAIETTRRLREREQSSFHWRGSSETFTTQYWINKFSKQSSQKQVSEQATTAIPKSSSASPKPICLMSEIDNVIEKYGGDCNKAAIASEDRRSALRANRRLLRAKRGLVASEVRFGD